MEDRIRELIATRDAAINGNTNPFMRKVVIISTDDTIKRITH